MKKIFTLLVSFTIVATSFAQFNSGGRKNNDYGKKDVSYNDGWNKNDGRYKKDYGTYYFSKRERDVQIAQINREYDMKIQSLKNRLFISRARKEKIICALDDQRKDEIKQVNAKFFDRHNRFDDHDQKRHW